MKLGSAICALSMALSSCTALDPLLSEDVGIDWSHRPANFPNLHVIEHDGDHKLVREHCGDAAPWYVSVEACARLHFGAGTCDVYFSRDSLSARARRHEIGHCEGYDHPGGSDVANQWAIWQRSNHRENTDRGVPAR